MFSACTGTEKENISYTVFETDDNIVTAANCFLCITTQVKVKNSLPIKHVNTLFRIYTDIYLDNTEHLNHSNIGLSPTIIMLYA